MVRPLPLSASFEYLCKRVQGYCKWLIPLMQGAVFRRQNLTSEDALKGLIATTIVVLNLKYNLQF